MTIVSRSINVSNAMPYTSASTINTALILNSLEKWDVTPCLIGTLFHLSANSPDPNMHEKFFCILVALFIPWHDHTPLKQAADSWEDHFHSRLPHLSPRIHHYMWSWILEFSMTFYRIHINSSLINNLPSNSSSTSIQFPPPQTSTCFTSPKKKVSSIDCSDKHINPHS